MVHRGRMIHVSNILLCLNTLESVMGVFLSVCPGSHSFCMCVGACMCVYECVCVHTNCIKSLQSGWLCSQTAQSGCVATKSPQSLPSPRLLLLFCVSVWTGLPENSPLNAPPCQNNTAACVCSCASASVCLCALRVLVICGFHRAEGMKEEEVFLPALQSHWQKDTELKSSLQFSFTLWVNIDVFSLNITESFKVCPARIQWLIFSALAFFLFLHPSRFPLFSSLPFTQVSLSSHSKAGILCVLTITLPPLNRPPFPLYLPCGLVREICTTSPFTPAAEVVHWIIHCTFIICLTAVISS